MAKRVTIKDIAIEAGVSIGSVHYALSGKEGVSDATRARILDIARNLSYTANSAAVSLKRKAVRVAAAFPAPVGENRFYFSYVWDGFRDCMASMRDFNIEILEQPYRYDHRDHATTLTRLADEKNVDGLVAAGHMDAQGTKALAALIDQGTTVVLLGDDIPESGRLCCVQPDYGVVGRMLAEVLLRQVPDDSPLLLCAGNIALPSQSLIQEGFLLEMRAQNRRQELRIVHGDDPAPAMTRRIVRELRDTPDITGCCALSARSSGWLGEALSKSGRSGTLPAIGCDLFRENIRRLRDGVFSNILHKHPYSQSHTATTLLMQHLLHGTEPPRDIVLVGSEVVFRSGLSLYNQSGKSSGNIVNRDMAKAGIF